MPIERETIVTSGGPSGGAVIAGVLAVIIAVLFALWLFNGGMNFGGGGGNSTIDIDVPAVSVTPDGQ